MTSVEWKASEKRVTAPFPTSDRSLANVKLRLDPSAEPTTEENRYVEPAADREEIRPELLLNVDADLLTADTRLPADGIAVSVIVRNRDLNRFKRVATWPLRCVPKDIWPLGRAVDRFSGTARLDIAVVAAPSLTNSAGDSLAIPAGAVLAARTFRIRAPSRSLDLPIRVVEPSVMSDQGLDRDTICFVHWKGENLQRAPADLVEIWLNKDFDDKFRAMGSRGAGAAAEHIGANISAYVYANVMAAVLNSGDGPDDTDGLVAAVADLVERELELSLDDLRKIWRDGVTGWAKLMPWCWKLAGANRAFATMKL